VPPNANPAVWILIRVIMWLLQHLTKEAYMNGVKYTSRNYNFAVEKLRNRTINLCHFGKSYTRGRGRSDDLHLTLIWLSSGNWTTQRQRGTGYSSTAAQHGGGGSTELACSDTNRIDSTDNRQCEIDEWSILPAPTNPPSTLRRSRAVLSLSRLTAVWFSRHISVSLRLSVFALG